MHPQAAVVVVREGLLAAPTALVLDLVAIVDVMGRRPGEVQQERRWRDEFGRTETAGGVRRGE